GKAAVVEPYPYDVAGKSVLMTSVVYPVFSHGKFIGVAGLMPMSRRHMSVMIALLLVAVLVVLRGFLVMLCGLAMMLGGLGMMLGMRARRGLWRRLVVLVHGLLLIAEERTSKNSMYSGREHQSCHYDLTPIEAHRGMQNARPRRSHRANCLRPTATATSEIDSTMRSAQCEAISTSLL
ncbi:MAG: hypothetical protein IJI03_19680, partial [Rudaea sp.]|nr:hypothetical protein [Rudaea sp.]